ncbi:MAG: RagB/SusD family nutrient uptake outer membrane protein [Bacteroidales bacterium]|nr:RagB/SusD family nutrient uptake outer membrane protein [Bacteroidales bacterium]
MKKIQYILSSVLVLATLFTSCVKDLSVTPIDPNKNTPDKALDSEAGFTAFLAGIYTGYATSGYKGPNEAPSIQGLDGGMSQYVRGMFHICELPTDVYVCGWNDEGIPDVCQMQWDASTGLIYSIYSRMFFQISQCNEFIRQAKASELTFANKEEYIAEARALRALCYYHALDNFGNVPFADETSHITETPAQISRADLYAWLETEMTDIVNNSALAGPRQAEYGRIDKGAVKFILAKLYLNAGVYTGTTQWKKCADVLKDLMDDGYSLHTTSRGEVYSPYQELFLADNDKCTDEIIFSIEQDGTDTQSYGVTNYLIFAFTGGKMDPAALGISSGWEGCRMTEQFYNKFEKRKDSRAIFYTKGQSASVNTLGTWTDGIAFMKYKNIASDGTPGKAQGFVDTDFPMMRYADVLLMAAECSLYSDSGISHSEGLGYFNEVRTRAGVRSLKKLDANTILDERARELYLELWRRQDLVRYDKFTTADYLWDWKGGVRNGQAVASYKNLYPIPTSDKMVNANLVQNEGYETN